MKFLVEALAERKNKVIPIFVSPVPDEVKAIMKRDYQRVVTLAQLIGEIDEAPSRNGRSLWDMETEIVTCENVTLEKLLVLKREHLIGDYLSVWQVTNYDGALYIGETPLKLWFPENY